MFLHARSKDRPFHLGPFALETLPRDPAAGAHELARRPTPRAGTEPEGPLAEAAAVYRRVFERHFAGEPSAVRAPVPDDLALRAAEAKGAAYFLDASQVGICRLPPNAWREGAAREAHGHALVILLEHGRLPEPDSLARAWIEPAAGAVEQMRAAEIAACLAGHIRAMGWSARAHGAGHGAIDLEMVAVLAGLAVRVGAELRNPYLDRFAIAAVTTDYALEPDRPLAEEALRAARGLGTWWGLNGARSGRERSRRLRRPTHLGPHPMETVRRVDRPTTLILDEEVPRVPKRASFFERALKGDLGEKARLERQRFASKTPLSASLIALVRAMVPHQDGPVAAVPDPHADDDPLANARALKSLSYHLGADATGICEIPPYAWYSHDAAGEPIRPYHRYAVVMLIDQGFDTMEGASGDDWISAAQAQRAYLRGIRARAQTNADSDVLHIPLALWAGLGELSRIGELVLNPFLGPRFKTVVLTTDLPLALDKPIDFGLQRFCQGCLKCARECPCDAIPSGGKVMFNGYEIWKPDVERCTRYRLTNARGAGCGRCMKTCPLNKVVDADGPVLARIASWLGLNAMWLKPVLVPIATWLDDRIGNGRRNPAKKWWFDHEIVGGAPVEAKSTNRRELDPAAGSTRPGRRSPIIPPPRCRRRTRKDRRRSTARRRWPRRR